MQADFLTRDRQTGSATSTFAVPTEGAMSDYSKGHNEYLATLIDPRGHNGVRIDDLDFTPSVPKTVLLTKTVTGATDYVFIITPAGSRVKVRVGRAVTNVTTGATNVFGYTSILAMDENLSLNYQKARLVSSVFELNSNTRSGATIDIAGDINATIMESLPDFHITDVTALTGYNTSHVLQGASIMDGAVTLYAPQTIQPFKVTATNATDYYDNAFVAGFTYGSVGTNSPTFSIGNLATSGSYQVVWSSYIAPTYYLPGFLTGRIEVEANFAANFVTASPTNQLAKVTFYYVNDSGNTVAGLVAPMCHSLGVTASGHVVVDVPFYVEKIDIQIQTSTAGTGGLSPNAAATVMVRCAELYDGANHTPMTIMRVGGVAAAQVLQFRGTCNYEAVPTAELSKELETDAKYVADRDDVWFAKHFIHSNRIRLCMTIPEYLSVLSKIDQFTLRSELVGSMSSWGSALRTIRKYGRPIGNALTRAFVPSALPAVNTAFRALGFSSGSNGTHDVYGSCSSAAMALPPVERVGKVASHDANYIPITTVMNEAAMWGRNSAVYAHSELPFLVGRFPIVLKGAGGESLGKVEPGLVIVSKLRVSKAEDVRVPQDYDLIQVQGRDVFVSVNMDDDARRLVKSMMKETPYTKTYVTLTSVSQDIPLGGHSFGGALLAALSGLSPDFFVSAVYDPETETLGLVKDYPQKESAVAAWGYPLLQANEPVDLKQSLTDLAMDARLEPPSVFFVNSLADLQLIAVIIHRHRRFLRTNVDEGAQLNVGYIKAMYQHLKDQGAFSDRVAKTIAQAIDEMGDSKGRQRVVLQRLIQVAQDVKSDRYVIDQPRNPEKEAKREKLRATPRDQLEAFLKDKKIEHAEVPAQFVALKKALEAQDFKKLSHEGLARLKNAWEGYQTWVKAKAPKVVPKAKKPVVLRKAGRIMDIDERTLKPSLPELEDEDSFQFTDAAAAPAAARAPAVYVPTTTTVTSTSTSGTMRVI